MQSPLNLSLSESIFGVLQGITIGFELFRKKYYLFDTKGYFQGSKNKFWLQFFSLGISLYLNLQVLKISRKLGADSYDTLVVSKALSLRSVVASADAT